MKCKCCEDEFSYFYFIRNCFHPFCNRCWENRNHYRRLYAVALVSSRKVTYDYIENLRLKCCI